MEGDSLRHRKLIRSFFVDVCVRSLVSSLSFEEGKCHVSVAPSDTLLERDKQRAADAHDDGLIRLDKSRTAVRTSFEKPRLTLTSGLQHLFHCSLYNL